MPKTYYDSELTAEQIEDALTAIDGVVNPGNNGKVLYIENGQIKAASASRWSGGYPEPTGTIQITQNGTVNVKDYASAEVNVSGGGSAVIQPLSVTQNGTYNPPSGVDGFAPVTVDVQGSSSGPLTYLTQYTEISNGYVGGDGIWYYNTSYSNLGTFLFTVEANHSYVFLCGISHERFRAMFTTVDLSTVTNNVTGEAVYDISNPTTIMGFPYTASQNGYVAIYVGGKAKKAYGFEGALP